MAIFAVSELVVGVAVAALTGITVFAYKHPTAYEKVCGPVLKMLALAFAGGLVWNAGNVAAYNSARPFIAADNMDEAWRGVRERMLPTDLYFWYVFMALCVYLVILHGIPLLLAEEKPVKEGHDK